MLPKQRILASCCINIHNHSPPLHLIQHHHQQRHFASAATTEGHGDQEHDHDHDHVWPTVPNPDPYQIFNYTRGSPYSKRKYYDLCKQYHPDRYCHGRHRHALPDKVRNERFKLIVAANEILSDPIKRMAYDRYGAGWNGQRSVRGWDVSRHGSRATSADGTAGPSPWWNLWSSKREGHPDPYNNATWEDWEKYRDHYSQPDSTSFTAQQPIFTSNAIFISLVLLFASIGGLATLSHAHENGRAYLAERDRQHEIIAKELQRRRKEAVRLGDKEERVRKFLRVRDPVGYAAGVVGKEGAEGKESNKEKGKGDLVAGQQAKRDVMLQHHAVGGLPEQVKA